MKETKKTKVINILGGPGSGKSSLLLALMNYCKTNSIDAEASMEDAKERILRGEKLQPSTQVYLLAKQHRRESSYYQKTDYIITDCPMWMSIAYEKELSSPPYVAKKIIKKYLAHSPNIEHTHILVQRPKKYNPSGRRQDEAEAKLFDKKYLFPMIKKEFGKIPTFRTGEYSLEEIIEVLKLK